MYTDGINLLHAGLICLFCAVEMLIQDAIWSIATKAIADGKLLKGAVFNAIGDGLGKATSLATIAIMTHALFADELAQVIGNMAGAFIGVFVSSQVSILLDRLFTGYHRHPAANPLGALGSTGLERQTVTDSRPQSASVAR